MIDQYLQVRGENDLKVMARTKVKAGIRLSIDVPSVGELYKIPAYPKACARKL